MQLIFPEYFAYVAMLCCGIAVAGVGHLVWLMRQFGDRIIVQLET